MFSNFRGLFGLRAALAGFHYHVLVARRRLDRSSRADVIRGRSRGLWGQIDEQLITKVSRQPHSACNTILHCMASSLNIDCSSLMVVARGRCSISSRGRRRSILALRNFAASTTASTFTSLFATTILTLAFTDFFA